MDKKFDWMDTAYHILRVVMLVLKYVLIVVILAIVGLLFSHVVNPLWIEGFMGANRDSSAFNVWNMVKNSLYFIWVFVFLITSIFFVINVIQNKLYKEWKKYIWYIVGFFFVGPIVLLPIVAFRKNKEEKNKRCRLFLYIYSMWVFIYASRFLGSILSDILVIISSMLLKPFNMKL